MRQNVFPMRGVFQFTLSGIVLVTSVISLALISKYYSDLRGLDKNMSGSLSGSTLPCVRRPLDVCSNSVADSCSAFCCPSGYSCLISPTQGLYCQSVDVDCPSCSQPGCSADFNWCLDLADVSFQCDSDACNEHRLVFRMSVTALVLCLLALLADLCDFSMYWKSPEDVKLKSSFNLFSGCIKWAAFGLLLGAQAAQFTSDVIDNRCFLSQADIVISKHVVNAFLGLSAFSASTALFLAPFSAYYGGTLNLN